MCHKIQQIGGLSGCEKASALNWHWLVRMLLVKTLAAQQFNQVAGKTCVAFGDSVGEQNGKPDDVDTHCTAEDKHNAFPEATALFVIAHLINTVETTKHAACPQEFQERDYTVNAAQHLSFYAVVHAAVSILCEIHRATGNQGCPH